MRHTCFSLKCLRFRAEAIFNISSDPGFSKTLDPSFHNEKILSSFWSPSAPEVKSSISAPIITNVALYEWRPQVYPGLAFAFKLNCLFFQSSHRPICLMLWILSIVITESGWDSLTRRVSSLWLQPGWKEEAEADKQHCWKKHR